MLFGDTEVKQMEADGVQYLVADPVALGEVDVEVLPKVCPRQHVTFQQQVEASRLAKFADGRLRRF
jgi:hypothetical protein